MGVAVIASDEEKSAKGVLCVKDVLYRHVDS